VNAGSFVLTIYSFAIQNVSDYYLNKIITRHVMVRLKDLAKKTGFSVTTVSRALGGFSDVNEHTRRQIMAAAQELGYQPNEVARQLRSQRTRTFGLIIPANDHSFSNDYFNELLRGIGDAAALQHYDLLISAQPPGDAEMQAYTRFVGGNRVDGMIVARTRQHDSRIAYLKSVNCPFVVAGRGEPDAISDFPFIDVDSQAGICSATEHLIELGHRHIGLILPPVEMAYTEYRRRGYVEALHMAGIPYREDYVLHGDLLRSGGYQGAQTLIDRCSEMTAIVCANDLMALGAIGALQSRGITVGREVAVTGFDDIPAAEYTHPSLTTVRQPIYEIGRRLVQMLIQIINDQPLENAHLLMPTSLMVRESTRRS
jgi:LacI family transcriptional regulator